MAAPVSSNSILSPIMASTSAIDQTFQPDREIKDCNSYSYSSCGCLFGIGSGRNRRRYVPLQPPHRQSDEEDKQSWMVKKVKRFKEIIKAMAARNWRTFINQIMNKRRAVRFQYDPTSYALNFDESDAGNGRCRDLAPPPASSVWINRTQM